MLTSHAPLSLDEPSGQPTPVVGRKSILNIIQHALHASEFRFAQDVCLGWLSAYPGDLLVSYHYAQSLLETHKTRQAVRILEGLCQVDPEFTDCVLALQAVQGEASIKSADQPADQRFSAELVREWVVALGDQQAEQVFGKAGKPSENSPGLHLFQAIHALQDRDFQGAQDNLLPVLGLNLGIPLTAALHLHLLAKSGSAPLQSLLGLSEHYLHQWPDLMVAKLYLATCLLESGQTARGVALLHEAARRDTSGQVATRLWGSYHRFVSLWPGALEIEFPWIIPATVAARIGWNRLTDGLGGPTQPATANADLIGELFTGAAIPTVIADVNTAAALASDFTKSQSVPQYPDSDYLSERKSLDFEILPIQNELFLAAERLNRPELKNIDARFPIYVVLTVKAALIRKYGSETAANIIAKANSLTIKVQNHAAKHADYRWGARLFIADAQQIDPKSGAMSPGGEDASSIKRALSALDKSLEQQGERIGAVLIVGGPEIVPFHKLPNPIDDQDGEICSDNPYACRSGNYFVPEWPVGRLPDGTGNDPSLLLEQLNRISNAYLPAQASNRRGLPWLIQIIRRLTPGAWQSMESFGYTAAVWKQASTTVFKIIGKPKAMLTSPPFSSPAPDANPSSSKNNGSFLKRSRFGYFNLHGLIDSPDWYGQRDYLAGSSGPDYPVALRPGDILPTAAGESSSKPPHLPEVVFSEACYGAYILDKADTEAISLMFIKAGSQAVVGSTAMAYGSIQAPLIAADYLGYQFWIQVKKGLPLGEALRRAKLNLAQEMQQRQGYLDGEDQKTLISFVLYGDPLFQAVPAHNGRKSIIRTYSPDFELATVCDRACQSNFETCLPENSLNTVQEVIAKYLPGMQGASMSISSERAACSSMGHECPNRQMKNLKNPDPLPNRKLVMLSKSISQQERNLTQVARLTLNHAGDLVKLVVSR